MSPVSKCTHDHYLVIDGQVITMTNDESKVFNQLINNVRNNARKMRTCGQADFRKCYGDCGICPYQCNGLIYHIDEDEEDFFTNMLSSDNWNSNCYQCFEEEFCSRETLQTAYEFAEEVTPRGSEILTLRIEYDMSIRGIAEELGMCRSVVMKRLNWILQALRAHTQLFA